jgi:light-harvesting protein B-800-850 alpha chain
MNNARLWTIVNPTVGVPIFFIALVVTSLFVHFQVLTRTTWFGDFIRGADVEVSAQVDQ